MRRKTLLSWSSGKDSAWALYKLLNDPEIELSGLFCTVNMAFNRVAMHGVRAELLHMQANSIGLPLEIIEIPYPCSNAHYEEIMGEFVERAKEIGIECFAFGDLFLEDIRQYREEKLNGSGIQAIFPLWSMPTEQLARTMVVSGLEAVITCIDPKQIAKNYVGRDYDLSFLESLPKDIDPCGENGEFHSFVFNGPMFKQKIEINVGEIVQRDGFVFADIKPDPSKSQGLFIVQRT